MNPRYLLMSLVCLGWLFAAGCTPSVKPAPTMPAFIPTPADTSLPTTSTPEPTTSPLPPTPSLAEVLATQGAQATADASLPTQTPNPTWTPTPTFTPIPGPVWRILFRAVRCPPSMSQCSNDLYMGQPPRWYLIDSDGSDLVALEETVTFLGGRWDYPHLSPDGTHLAYLVLSETDNELHVMLSEISSGHTSDLGVAPREFRALKFLPEPGCLAVYSSPRWDEPDAIESITVTKLCADSTERQILETVEFPNLRRYSQYRLSPQGDALLIMTWNADNMLELYVYEFGSQEPPHLLFAAEDDKWSFGSVRWLPDSQGIEFYVQQIKPGAVNALVYTSNRQATDIQVKLELELPFSLEGAWSPDGREIAFFSIIEHTPETSGVYILDLESGEWRQIVSGFYISESYDVQIRTWPAEVPW